MDSMDIILGSLLRKRNPSYLNIRVDKNGESGFVHYYEAGAEQYYKTVRFTSQQDFVLIMRDEADLLSTVRYVVIGSSKASEDYFSRLIDAIRKK